MAKFKFLPTTNVDGHFSAKLKGALTDADVGKPFKLSVDTTDTYELCADGDFIDAFLVGLEAETADGLKFGTLMGARLGDRKRVEASGALTVGGLVEAGAVAAAGTAETNGLPLVSAKAAVAADLADSASGALIATSVNALLAEAQLAAPKWRVISGNTENGTITTGDTTVIIERI